MSRCIADVCVAAMVSNNATVLPFSFHLIFFVLIGKDRRNAFNFYGTKLCQERFPPLRL